MPPSGRVRIAAMALFLCLNPAVYSQPSNASPVRVHVFIRAFIPNNHPGNPGYVRGIPSHPGLFVIPSPAVRMVHGVPLPFSDGTCFMTDNRGFSNDIGASSRLVTEFILVIAGNTATVEKANNRDLERTGPSHKVDCNTGVDVVPSKSASTADMHSGTPAVADGLVEIVVDGRANNPLSPLLIAGRPISPDIQYGGSFTFNTNDNTLRFKGSVAIFPAYEAYAQMEGGLLTTVFQSPPTPGSTAVNLIDFGTGFGLGKIKLQPIDVSVKLAVTQRKDCSDYYPLPDDYPNWKNCNQVGSPSQCGGPDQCACLKSQRLVTFKCDQGTYQQCYGERGNGCRGN